MAVFDFQYVCQMKFITLLYKWLEYSFYDAFISGLETN